MQTPWVVGPTATGQVPAKSQQDRRLSRRRSADRTQRLTEPSLLFVRELLAVAGDIEDVDRLMRLRVDQDHLDIASVIGDSCREVVEQAGTVLRHDFDQRRRMAGSVVEVDSAGN